MKHNFRELKIWQRSKDLAIEVYTLTKDFPKEEVFGLTSQLRRCSISIPSNIAEGCGRNTTKHLLNYLNISMGSLAELETQMIISIELKFITTEKGNSILKEIDEIQKMIAVFMTKV